MSAKRIGRPPVPLQERFWRKVTLASRDQCWLWQGAKDLDGYGFIKRKDGVQLRAHRVSHELHHGPVPLGMFVCHTCDTPSCVNPDHLFLGTAKDNTDDMIRKGRKPKPLGESNPMARLTSAQVLSIRSDTRQAKDVAAAYGIVASTVLHIKAFRAWRHLCAT